MDKIKTKVESVIIGDYDVDSITVKINNRLIEICFPKSEKVEKYEGKDIHLSQIDGIYKID